jgi:hypothetical protein
MHRTIHNTLASAALPPIALRAESCRAERLSFRRFSSAVATSREGHRPRWARDQAGKCRPSDRGLGSKAEVIAGLDLKPPRVSGRDAVAILPSGFPVLKKKASAAAGNGITTAANANDAIPVRAFKGMNDWSVMTFLRRLWKIVAVNDS